MDDSRAMRMMVMRELRRSGYGAHELVEAESGPSALECVAKGGIELVLSDWNMPGMSGFELLTELRRLGSNVPFGLLTSESASSSRVRALSAGASFVITKPFASPDLAHHIAVALGRGADDLPEDDEGKEDGRPPDVESVLSRLLRREVEVVESGPPRREKPRAFARYMTPAGEDAAFCIAELSFAAAAAAALSLMPATAAAEWSRSGALPASAQQNFHEVANVLARVLRLERERCVLHEVTIVTDYEDASFADRIPPKAKRSNFDVSINGYPSGRISLVSV